MLERTRRINNNRVACKGEEEKVEADHINKHPEGSKDKINITRTLMKQEEVNEGDALRSNDDFKLIGLNWLRMIEGHDNRNKPTPRLSRTEINKKSIAKGRSLSNNDQRANSSSLMNWFDSRLKNFLLTVNIGIEPVI
ncbi:hypothetical protein BY996DRAFT_6606235 [Phakopsora pachyrhizi]|nr:hypothetical protein BY996DRAFT_6457636 [Phakopsora pachyrhizi]KAI8455064.1 hypothetical protein BY996DRAFT_6606235 [Phakopsora pachyrhizi]